MHCSLIFYTTSLQTLLRKKAAEELKREQERKAEERKRMITERCGQPKDIENANEGMIIHFVFLFCDEGSRAFTTY